MKHYQWLCLECTELFCTVIKCDPFCTNCGQKNAQFVQEGVMI